MTENHDNTKNTENQEKITEKTTDNQDKTLKKDDFIELEYTGITKDDEVIFDTTDEKLAKDNDIYNPQMKYGSMIICIGEGQVIKGLDSALIGKESGKNYTIEIPPEEAFGKRSGKQILLVNTNKFKKQNINPMPGLQVNIDNTVGVIKTVTGGRTLVDFNHPLSGKDLIYNIKINKIIDDDKIKAQSYMEVLFGKDVKTDIQNKILTINTKVKLPEEITNKLKETIIRIIKSVEKVEFVTDEKKSDGKTAPKTETTLN